jgi:hypothetical protein
MVVGGERDAERQTDTFDALIRKAQNSTVLYVREVLNAVAQATLARMLYGICCEVSLECIVETQMD